MSKFNRSEITKKAWSEAKTPRKILVWGVAKFEAIAYSEIDGLFIPDFDIKKATALSTAYYVAKAKKEGTFISFENNILTFYK